MQDPGPFSGQTSGQTPGQSPVRGASGPSPFGRVWLTCFVALFLLAELLQWLKGFRVPGPVFWVGGGLLAIASNFDRRAGVPFKWFPGSEGTEPPRPPLHAPGSTGGDRAGASPLGHSTETHPK
ncbi:MAG: hypothetical protein MH825_07855 [Cyanobacteria bacterium]|nr:hypothetical protein [Cyanobacteriota bacterium]